MVLYEYVLSNVFTFASGVKWLARERIENIRRKSDPVNVQSHLCFKWKLFFYLATVAADKYFNMHWNLLRIMEQLFFDLSL